MRRRTSGTSIGTSAAGFVPPANARPPKLVIKFRALHVDYRSANHVTQTGSSGQRQNIDGRRSAAVPCSADVGVPQLLPLPGPLSRQLPAWVSFVTLGVGLVLLGTTGTL